jgi:AraC-like DNA-binding protein
MDVNVWGPEACMGTPLDRGDWLAAMRSQYPDAVVPAAPDGGGRWEPRRFGELRLTRIAASALRVDHPAALGADRDDLGLLLNLGTTALVLHAGAETMLPCGAALVIDPRLPSSIRGAAGLRQYVIEMPRTRFTCDEIGAAAGRAFDGGALLRRWVRGAWHAAAIGAPAANPGGALIAGLRCAGALAVGGRARDDDRVASVLDLVDAEDPEARFDARSLAARVGLSRRRLDALFAARGATVERALWTSRLLRASEALADPQRRQHRLLDVALAHGFQTQAHFGHAFAGLFGCTPGQWRGRSRGGASATRGRHAPGAGA